MKKLFVVSLVLLCFLLPGCAKPKMRYQSAEIKIEVECSSGTADICISKDHYEYLNNTNTPWSFEQEITGPIDLLVMVTATNQGEGAITINIHRDGELSQTRSNTGTYNMAMMDITVYPPPDF